MDARRAQCRGDPEQQRGRAGYESREGQNTPVQPEIEEYPVGGRRELPHEQSAAPSREEQPEACAACREQQALEEQLPDEPPSRRPNGNSHAHFVTPRIRACEQKVCDVRAGDQQDEHDHDHDRCQWRLVATAKSRVAGRRAAKREWLVQVILSVFRTPVLRYRRFADLRLNAPEC